MKKHIIITGILVFIFSFILYLITLAPGLMFTDSGELAGAALTLGVAHPSGYPLFILLAKIFSVIPISSSPIYQLNIFAAVCVSFASVMFFLIALEVYKYLNNNSKKRELKIQSKKTKNQAIKHNSDNINFEISIKEIIISGISALLFASARTIWDNALMLEVYPLQILMFNLIIFVFIKSLNDIKNQKKLLITLAFVLGLSFANHLTTILILPMLFLSYFLFYNDLFASQKEKMKFLGFLILPFVIGLSPYIFIYVRSLSEPIFNWGDISRSFDKFIYHVSGKQFQVWMFTGEGIKENFLSFIELFPYQLGLIGIIPLVWGIIEGLKISKKLTSVLLIGFVSTVIYSINYSIHDIESYFSLAVIIALIFTSIGFYLFSKVLKKYYYLIVLFPIISICINYSLVDKSENNLVNTYTETFFNSIDKNAIVISSQWDYLVSAFWYKQKIEGFRPDVALVESELLRRTWFLPQLSRWSPDVLINSKTEIENYLQILERFESGEKFSDIDNYNIQKAYIDLFHSIIDNNLNKRPIYITIESLQKDPEIINKYSLEPQGLAIRIKDKGDTNSYFKNFSLSRLSEAYSKVKNNEESDHLIKGMKDFIMNFTLNVSLKYYTEQKQWNNAEKIVSEVQKLEPLNGQIESIKQNLQKEINQNGSIR